MITNSVEQTPSYEANSHSASQIPYPLKEPQVKIPFSIILPYMPRYLKLFLLSRLTYYIHFLPDPCPTHLTLHVLITLIIFSEKYKL
jgi:hypothetical protein